MRWRKTGSSAAVPPLTRVSAASCVELRELVGDRGDRAEGEPGALVHQRRQRHRPAVADAADDVLVGDPRLVHEDLVELALAGDLDQRLGFDALLLHVHQEVGEALVLGGVGVGAGDEHAPLRELGQGRPDLLPGDDPFVAVLDGAGLQRGEVGARLGLREALAPDLVGVEDRLQVALLLLVGAVGDDHRAAHRQAEHVGRARRLQARGLADEDRLLDHRRAAAAVLLRPGDAGPTGLVQLVLPLAPEGDHLVEAALGLGPGVVLLEPGADLVAELLLGWREGQVHRRAAYRGTGRAASRPLLKALLAFFFFAFFAPQTVRPYSRASLFASFCFADSSWSSVIGSSSASSTTSSSATKTSSSSPSSPSGVPRALISSICWLIDGIRIVSALLPARPWAALRFR